MKDMSAVNLSLCGRRAPVVVWPARLGNKGVRPNLNEPPCIRQCVAMNMIKLVNSNTVDPHRLRQHLLLVKGQFNAHQIWGFRLVRFQIKGVRISEVSD